MLNKPQNSNCDFAQQLVSYLYDEFKGHEKTVFEKHLSNCLFCKEELLGFSMTRTALLEWHQEEFLPLENPVIEIPYKVENKSNSDSWFASIRNLFNFSPVWATAVILVIGIGLILTVIYSSTKTNNDTDILARNDAADISLQTPTKEQNNLVSSTESNINLTDTKVPATASPKDVSPQSPKVSTPVKTSTVAKTQKKMTPKTNTQIQTEPRKVPTLIEEDYEVATLRLTDLLEEVGTR